MTNQATRQRKLLRSDDKTAAGGGTQHKRRPKKTPESNLLFSFMCLCVSATILILLFGFYTDSLHTVIDEIAGKFGYHDKIYAVIIDAGSTGSRVLAYTFHRGYLDGRLVIDDELFHEMKPGLSSYVHDSKAGAEKLSYLFDKAKTVVPKAAWESTPIVVKATAGLRLLGVTQAQEILDEVQIVLDNSGFLVPPNAVEIMDGTDEGIFSWFTINFLLDRLNSGHTVAALDLGGGSTQVTFAPKDASRTPAFADYMHRVQAFKSQVDVFTHSYLNLGLMAVRHAVFTDGQPPNTTNIESICVNPIAKNKSWKYANVEYTISGKNTSKTAAKTPVVNFKACYALVESKVIPLVKPKPVTLKESQIAAFSYYYERAIETGIVDPYKGGVATVESFFNEAVLSCATPNVDQPFMCVDLTFIAIILEHGYGLKRSTPIKLYKQVNNHEISWALGCAYNILTDQANKEKINKI